MSQLETTTFDPEECAWCLGAGRIHPGVRCLVCKSRGAVLVAQPSQVCSDCRGTGREGRVSDGPPCAQCGGAGWKGVYQPLPTVRA